MYLSKLVLNPRSAQALIEADDPYQMHRTLSKVFGDRLGDARLLFRVDWLENENPHVIAQSLIEPEWSLLPQHYTVAEPSVTLPTWARDRADETFWALEEQEQVRFRLLCRPSRKPSGDFGVRTNGKRRSGPRVTTMTDEEAINWLNRKGEALGFEIQTVRLSRISFRDSKEVVARNGADALSEEEARRLRNKPLGAVQFDGVLVVTDPDKLREAVRNGIGPQKAYGFGLLSLAPVR